MKKFITILFLFVGIYTNAQQFKFSCECSNSLEVFENIFLINPGSFTDGARILGVILEDGTEVRDGGDLTGSDVTRILTDFGTATLEELGITVDDFHKCSDGAVIHRELPFVSVPSGFGIDLTPILPALRAAGLEETHTHFSITSEHTPGEYVYSWINLLYDADVSTSIWWRRDAEDVITGIRVRFSGQYGVNDVSIEGGTPNELIQQAIMFNRVAKGQTASITYNTSLTYTYSDDSSNTFRTQLLSLNVDEFAYDGGRFFATETGRYTRPHFGNNNSSVIDLTPVGDILNAYLVAIPFSTTNTFRYQLELFEPGKYYYHLGPNGVGAIGLAVNATDIDYIDSGNTTEGTHTYWEIQDPSGFGIVKVDILALGPSDLSGNQNYEGFYDLRGFAWGERSTTTNFDTVNGIGRQAFFDHIAADALSGIIYSAAYTYSLHHNIIDGSAAPDVFGEGSGQAALLRSYSTPRGYGLYASGPTFDGNGVFYALWYSHDLVHDWEQGADNDFQGRGVPNRLSGARFIIN